MQRKTFTTGCPERCLGYNCVTGIQGCYFINKARVFLTSKETTMDWKRQTCRSQQPCFYTCLTVKGTESRKPKVFQSKLGQNVSLQMWTPKKSVVVAPPKIEIKGKCIFRERKQVKEPVDETPVSEVDVLGEQRYSVENSDISRNKQEFKEGKHGMKNKEGGQIILTVLEASLKKKLNPEYIDIIPRRLNRSTLVRSPQFDSDLTKHYRSSPKQAVEEEKLPVELKFGIRNPRKSPLITALKRTEVSRPKTELSFYRGKLEPLLPREIPSKNLHEELEKEEADGNREIRYT